MCLILVAWQACAGYPLVIAANRDEAYSRPALPLARWSDDERVYGGRDVQAGGGWLGIASGGRFAALTNFRQGGARDVALRTRGELVSNYLRGETPPRRYAEAASRDGGHYNGFSLLVGDGDAMYFHSNRGDGVQRVGPGVHGLSNHLLDEPWPKVTAGTAALASWLTLDVDALAANLFSYLADRTVAPDHLLPSTGVDRARERELSAAFIAAEHYGTRASSVIVVRADGGAYFGERGFGPHGAPLYERTVRFATALRARDAGESSRGEVSRLP